MNRARSFDGGHQLGASGWLKDAHVHLGLVRYQPITSRAIPPDFQGSATRRMHRCLGGDGMPGPPVRKQPQGASEFHALRCQLIRSAWRSLDVRSRDQESVTLEPLEALGQDIRCDPWNVLQQFVEPPRSGKQGLYDEQGPPVANPNECRCQRGCSAIARCGFPFGHRPTVCHEVLTPCE